MPPQTPNPSPLMNGNQMPPQSLMPEKKAIGPVAGTIIVLLLLLVGGLYFWGAQLNREEPEVPYIPSNDTMPLPQEMTSDVSAGLPAQNDSDDVASIEADAEAMNLDQLDASNSASIDGF